MDDIMNKAQNETPEEYLWRIGQMKENKETALCWEELAEILNENLSAWVSPKSETYWRKRYKRLRAAFRKEKTIIVADEAFSDEVRQNFIDMEKQRIRLRDERNAYARQLRADARHQAFLDTFLNEMKQYEKPKITETETLPPSERTMFVMLSDIHFGLTFANPYSRYNTAIATERILAYSRAIIERAKEQNARACHVSIMGDLISGAIHQTIRIENKENVIRQIVGVSELISDFLFKLSEHFDLVTVSNVSGNHSRIESNPDNALREERLDDLVPWYCKAKLSRVNNVCFEPNIYDATFAVKELYGKTYVSVHGDFDGDPKASAVRLSELIGRNIDYMLLAHMHVADIRFEKTTYIRNGAVVTGGDEYTAKKRLFGPAVQVCFVADASGIKSIFPILLS